MHPRDSLATQSDFAKKKPTCSISLWTDIPNFSKLLGVKKTPKIIRHHLWMLPKPKMAYNILTKVEDSCDSDIYEVGFIA